MKAVIVDDERLARSELKRMLKKHPEIQVVGEASNPDMARDLISKLSPDVLFLDIQMPGQNGFELLESLDFVPAVVFTTAYDEHAIRAFEVNALDYLLKPLEEDRLAGAIEKALAQASENKRRLTSESRFFVKDGERCWFVKLKEVRLFESEGNYTRLYFGKERPLIYRSLRYLDERLDHQEYFRAGRKHIIGLRWISSIRTLSSGALKACLEGGQEIEMSRRQSRRFREIMGL